MNTIKCVAKWIATYVEAIDGGIDCFYNVIASTRALSRNISQEKICLVRQFVALITVCLVKQILFAQHVDTGKTLRVFVRLCGKIFQS